MTTNKGNNASGVASREENNTEECHKCSTMFRQRNVRTKKELTLNQIINIASTDEIIGFDDNGNHHNQAQSVCFSYSFLLGSSPVRQTFRYMLMNSKNSKSNIVNLLMLEKNSVKWYGNKIPYAYFSFCLPEKIAKWTDDDEDDTNFREKIDEVQTTDMAALLTAGKIHILNEKLILEINFLKHSLYSLSEQEASDLGLMCPKIFIKSRADSIAKGLLEDHKKENDIIVLDDHDSL